MARGVKPSIGQEIDEYLMELQAKAHEAAVANLEVARLVRGLNQMRGSMAVVSAARVS